MDEIRQNGEPQVSASPHPVKVPELSPDHPLLRQEVGTYALRSYADFSASDDDQKTFVEPLRDYVDTNRRQPLEQQLALTRRFWEILGYRQPEIAGQQLENLAQTLDLHPQLRVLPTPFLNLQGRIAMAGISSSQAGSDSTRELILHVPKVNPLYEDLVANPQTSRQLQADYYSVTHRLGYHFLNKPHLPREDYLKALVSSGAALHDQNSGRTWSVPVIDVSYHTLRRSGLRLDRLFEMSDDISTPETLISLRLLHHLAGIKSKIVQRDVVNEGVYRFDSNTGQTDLLEIATVAPSTTTRPSKIVLSTFSPHVRNALHGIRGLINGILPNDY